jgi:hypothetical protein
MMKIIVAVLPSVSQCQTDVDGALAALALVLSISSGSGTCNAKEGEGYTLEVRNSVNRVMCHCERLTAAVAALCSWDLVGSANGKGNGSAGSADDVAARLLSSCYVPALLEQLSLLVRWSEALFKRLCASSKGADGDGAPIGLGGRLRVDIARFLTQVMPALLYVDIYIAFTATTAATSSSSSSSPSSSSPSMEMPSDVLWLCEQAGVVSFSSLCRVLVTTARAPTVSYYAKCRGLAHLRSHMGRAIVSMLSRYMHAAGQGRFGITVVCGAAAADDDGDDGGDGGGGGGGGGGGDGKKKVGMVIPAIAPSPVASPQAPQYNYWYNEEPSRVAFKRHFGADLAALLAKIVG